VLFPNDRRAVRSDFAGSAVPWFNWTRQLLSAVEVVLVSGLNTIPGLRQVVESLAAVRTVDRVSRESYCRAEPV